MEHFGCSLDHWWHEYGTCSRCILWQGYIHTGLDMSKQCRQMSDNGPDPRPHTWRLVQMLVWAESGDSLYQRKINLFSLWFLVKKSICHKLIFKQKLQNTLLAFHVTYFVKSLSYREKIVNICNLPVACPTEKYKLKNC